MQPESRMIVFVVALMVLSAGLGNAADYCADTLMPQINALPPQGGEVIVPAGTHICESSLSITKTVTLRGLGSQVSVLKWILPTNGIVFTGTVHATHRLIVRDLALVTNQEGAGTRTAIRATWPFTPSTTYPSLTVQSVEILGGPTGSPGYWNIGIDMVDAWHPKIEDTLIRGKFNGRQMDYGVRASSYTIAARIDKVDAYFMKTGFEFRDKSEGPAISDCNIVYVTIGMHFTDDGVDIPLAAFVYENHIAAFAVGIRALNRPDGDYSGNLIYRRDDQLEWFVGIELKGDVSRSRVRGNYVWGVTQTMANGLVTNASRVSFIGNQVRQSTTGIWFQSGSSLNRATANDGYELLYPTVLDSGTNNHITDNN